MFQQRKFMFHYLVLLATGLWLAACASAPINVPTDVPTSVPTSAPAIDTSAMTTFRHPSGVFSLKVPQAWKQIQDDAPTESIAAFSEPDGRAELIAYSGLLDRQLSETEGSQVVTNLIKVLLNSPGDLLITDLQRQPTGAYTANLSFTRAGEKRSGIAVFRDEPLALSGVILSGPEAGWADFQKAMQPTLDSFKVDLNFVQGTYFAPFEGELYALATPAEWESRNGPGFAKIRSPNGQLQIVVAQRAEEKTLTPNELADMGVKLGQTSLGKGTLTGTELLPDGRVKVTLDQGTHTAIGYLEQNAGVVIGLFFETPSDRLAAYQPLIDFIYSTYIIR